MLIVCNAFPVLSETFVVDHVVGMASSGWRATVAASAIDRIEAERIQEREDVHFGLAEVPGRGISADSRGALVAAGAALRLLRHAPLQLANRIAWTCARRAAGMAKVIDSVSPELIHAHFGPNGVAAALASDRPLLVDFHGYDFTSWPQRWGWSLYRQTLKRAMIISHSAFAERKLAEAGLRGSQRVTIGVDRERFAVSARGTNWPVPLRLLSVGRLVEGKGHDVALRAVARLRQSRPGLPLRLRIVGAGPLRDDLVALAGNLGIADLVDGPVPVDYGKMPAVYREADVLIAASQTTSDGWAEAFCRVAVEAMSCGAPVVATPCGGLPDTVGPGGIVSADETADSVAAAISRVIDAGDPSFWQAEAVASAARFGIDRMRTEYAARAAAMLHDRRSGRDSVDAGNGLDS